MVSIRCGRLNARPVGRAAAGSYGYITSFAVACSVPPKTDLSKIEPLLISPDEAELLGIDLVSIFRDGGSPGKSNVVFRVECPKSDDSVASRMRELLPTVPFGDCMFVIPLTWR